MLKKQGVAGLRSGVPGMGRRGGKAGNLAKRARNKELEQEPAAPGARPTPGVPLTIVLTDVFTFAIVRHGFRVGREKKPSESH
jgi:hypothetical protein